MMIFEDILLPQVLIFPAYLVVFWKFFGWGSWISGGVALPAGILTAVAWWALQDWRRRRKTSN